MNRTYVFMLSHGIQGVLGGLQTQDLQSNFYSAIQLPLAQYKNVTLTGSVFSRE